MRDPKAYVEAGRNDPLSDDQRREHPYDFVSLPERPVRGQAVGHHRHAEGRLSGSITLIYKTLVPLHVGSGVFETAADCGLEGGALPVRGIVRSQGRPVLPGSSWKGPVRARYEAITCSTLGQRAWGGREPAFKVPEALKQPTDRPGMYNVRLEDPRLRNLEPQRVKKGGLDHLSPAEALFGAMGYRGRVYPGEGAISGPAAKEPLVVAPLDSPVPHRLAKPGAIRNVGRNQLQISRVEGRKFYYDGDIVHQRRTESAGGVRTASEDIDQVPAGSTITIEVALESVTEAEFGALLIAAGFGKDSGVLRFGGYKPVGLGKVELERVEPRLHRAVRLDSWKRGEPEAIDIEAAVEGAIGTLVDREALDELHQVTTRRRPPEVQG